MWFITSKALRGRLSVSSSVKWHQQPFRYRFVSLFFYISIFYFTKLTKKLIRKDFLASSNSVIIWWHAYITVLNKSTRDSTLKLYPCVESASSECHAGFQWCVGWMYEALLRHVWEFNKDVNLNTEPLCFRTTPLNPCFWSGAFHLPTLSCELAFSWLRVAGFQTTSDYSHNNNFFILNNMQSNSYVGNIIWIFIGGYD